MPGIKPPPWSHLQLCAGLQHLGCACCACLVPRTCLCSSCRAPTVWRRGWLRRRPHFGGCACCCAATDLPWQHLSLCSRCRASALQRSGTLSSKPTPRLLRALPCWLQCSLVLLTAVAFDKVLTQSLSAQPLQSISIAEERLAEQRANSSAAAHAAVLAAMMRDKPLRRRSFSTEPDPALCLCSRCRASASRRSGWLSSEPTPRQLHARPCWQR